MILLQKSQISKLNELLGSDEAILFCTKIISVSHSANIISDACLSMLKELLLAAYENQEDITYALFGTYAYFKFDTIADERRCGDFYQSISELVRTGSVVADVNEFTGESTTTSVNESLFLEHLGLINEILNGIKNAKYHGVQAYDSLLQLYSTLEPNEAKTLDSNLNLMPEPYQIKSQKKNLIDKITMRLLNKISLYLDKNRDIVLKINELVDALSCTPAEKHTNIMLILKDFDRNGYDRISKLVEDELNEKPNSDESYAQLKYGNNLAIKNKYTYDALIEVVSILQSKIEKHANIAFEAVSFIENVISHATTENTSIDSICFSREFKKIHDILTAIENLHDDVSKKHGALLNLFHQYKLENAEHFGSNLDKLNSSQRREKKIVFIDQMLIELYS